MFDNLDTDQEGLESDIVTDNSDDGELSKKYERVKNQLKGSSAEAIRLSKEREAIIESSKKLVDADNRVFLQLPESVQNDVAKKYGLTREKAIEEIQREF